MRMRLKMDVIACSLPRVRGRATRMPARSSPGPCPSLPASSAGPPATAGVASTEAAGASDCGLVGLRARIAAWCRALRAALRFLREFGSFGPADEASAGAAGAGAAASSAGAPAGGCGCGCETKRPKGLLRLWSGVAAKSTYDLTLFGIWDPIPQSPSENFVGARFP